MNHSAWWMFNEGQLGPHERVWKGFADQSAALLEAQHMRGRGNAMTVRLLTTTENPRSSDDPDYDAAHAYQSERWCAIFTNWEN